MGVSAPKGAHVSRTPFGGSLGGLCSGGSRVSYLGRVSSRKGEKQREATQRTTGRVQEVRAARISDPHGRRARHRARKAIKPTATPPQERVGLRPPHPQSRAMVACGRHGSRETRKRRPPGKQRERRLPVATRVRLLLVVSQENEGGKSIRRWKEFVGQARAGGFCRPLLLVLRYKESR